MSKDNLEKVHIDLPNHWATGGESMWATPLGNNLYRIENIPFYAYGINFLDIVYATSDTEEHIPEVREIVTPSGRRTYRVIFSKEMHRDKQVELLDSLDKYEASYERANDTMVSIDIKPSGDHLAVYDKLDYFEAQNYLSFETCEARMEGSFDDLPKEND